jgi:hypothetical protein
MRKLKSTNAKQATTKSVEQREPSENQAGHGLAHKRRQSVGWRNRREPNQGLG